LSNPFVCMCACDLRWRFGSNLWLSKLRGWRFY
jgi:hypothetical protein